MGSGSSGSLPIFKGYHKALQGRLNHKGRGQGCCSKRCCQRNSSPRFCWLQGVLFRLVQMPVSQLADVSRLYSLAVL